MSGASVSYSHVQEPPEHLTKRVAKDHVVAFHYALREVRPDGTVSHWLESSFGRQPLLYLHGHNNVVPGLEAGLDGKKAGDQLSVTLSPEQAYGLRTSNEVLRVPIKHLAQAPAAKHLKPGVIVGVKTNKGVRNMLVLKAGKFNVDVDTNHPYAGRTLEYQIEILGVRTATEREVSQRRPGAR
ncbi:peptidyl-prolyl cis-trans isomerase [Pseudohongiella nitratireducens]|uniref:Peptidyl-prolyl cis-trans isomerase n=1 Tax=Pseudohongiella nitratireducens TaxID=1768907 RepID=A0A916QLU0_9GAMM|nr:FKBP-type peptidyl-prolyl cis-trans isomerase [Pseudohongiella nitratireducens]MDF1622338.1 FKBP-type peptidyl-prolyl cis-trans isomerase [Pseudohongiella nitratireducens]GFZ80400.1 peptidyl-prolyl cis-trans isomerase [Pseudohongiella nitratireducens]